MHFLFLFRAAMVTYAVIYHNSILYVTIFRRIAHFSKDYTAQSVTKRISLRYHGVRH